MEAYRKLMARRRLVWLILIYPAYKVIDALVSGETQYLIFYIILLGICLASALFVEYRIRHPHPARPQSQQGQSTPARAIRK